MPPRLGAMDLGRVGIWTAAFAPLPASTVRRRAAELDELGYGAIWVPDAIGRDPFVECMLLLEGSERLTVAAGIANIYGRDPHAMRAAWEATTEAGDGRFVLGLGVSHATMVEGLLGREYGPPLAAMRTYLERVDGALYVGATAEQPLRRVLAALGPGMLALAAEQTSGALTYFVPVEHTPVARAALGPDRLLAVEQAVVLESDPDVARAVAREHMSLYLRLPNYTNNLRRLGFGDDDLDDGGSDRLVDALVAWGDEHAIRARVDAQHDAGADHVCVQVLTAPALRDCGPEWHALASALLG